MGRYETTPFLARCGTLWALTPKKHIAVELVGRTLVVVHDAMHPSDGDWQIYLDALRTHRDAIEAQLIVTDGGSPTAAQRRASLEYARGRPLPATAVLTSSVLVRGVVSALSWFMKERIRAFAKTEMSDACAFIDAAKDAAKLEDTAQRLRRTLG
ncbi:MAG: hypothetical protein ABW133_18725 [Polyangiaceae bacterium]